MLEESNIKTDVLASFRTNHSRIFFSLQLKVMPTGGKGFGNLNPEYVEKKYMENQVFGTLRTRTQEKITYKHL